MDADYIKEGDYVFINGSGVQRIGEARKGVRLRLDRCRSAFTDGLVGLRYGEVVRLSPRSRSFRPCADYPDLDLSGANATGERDNRDLVCDNRSQQLTKDEIAEIRREKGVETLLNSLVENSVTYQSKTNFSKEKYLVKKKKKYGELFKVQRVTADNMCEVQVPSIAPLCEATEEPRWVRLRADTVALILHHSNLHDASRVLLFERTNGVMPAYILGRLGDAGRIFQLMEKSAQPNVFTASQLGLQDLKKRWKAVPNNEDFLTGVSEKPKDDAGGQASPDESPDEGSGAPRPNPPHASQWMKGLDARQELLERPADSLIVVDDTSAEKQLACLLPFLACGGHLVVYSPFLEDLTDLFPRLRMDCVNIRISETWYRHYQVLPQRTHPTVNMSTAGGYLLTAIKVERNPNPSARFMQGEPLFVSNGGNGLESRKRDRNSENDYSE
ncbi:unnamed protein product [Phytomonas sp. EM1]|nr:unnamed protein product [Phytomonas sp. EM1]|eukprot:CCW63296.1 unnamed protein product [Phytomonas sp. isolate EM1]